MSQSFERIWVSFVNSTRFRRFAKGGLGSKIVGGQASQQLNMARHYVTSYYQSRKDRTRFQDVNTFCVFIGHNKSGSSMLGSLLDAHPQIVLSDEAGAMRYVSAGFSQNQIFHLLLRVSRREAMKGRVTARRMTPYSFAVPGQWQGRYTTLRVIGDGTTGSSTQRFFREPDLLQRLQQVMEGREVKFIQVIRNPYDPISYMMVRGKRSFANAIEHYFANCSTLVDMRKALDPSRLYPVRYEDFIRQPDRHLSQICRFLGVEASPDYLQSCRGILRQSPDQHRHMVDWNAKWITVVQNQIDQYDFLAGYSFET